MRFRVAVAVVLWAFIAVAFGQKGTPDEQRACLKQGQQHVADVNKRAEATYFLRQSHYSLQTKSCYVLLEEVWITDISNKSVVVHDWHLADAYESNDIGVCTEWQEGSYKWEPCRFRDKDIPTLDEWSNFVKKEMK